MRIARAVKVVLMVLGRFSHSGAWSKGKYYRCMTYGCSEKSKSVARAKLEGGSEDILKRLEPSNRLLDLAEAMLKQPWNSRMELAQAERDEWRRQAETADRSLLELIDRLVETKSATVIKARGSKIEKLEREKIAIVEKAAEPLPNAGSFEECIELSFRLLSRP